MFPPNKSHVRGRAECSVSLDHSLPSSALLTFGAGEFFVVELSWALCPGLSLLHASSSPPLGQPKRSGEKGA